MWKILSLILLFRIFPKKTTQNTVLQIKAYSWKKIEFIQLKLPISILIITVLTEQSLKHSNPSFKKDLMQSRMGRKRIEILQLCTIFWVLDANISESNALWECSGELLQIICCVYRTESHPKPRSNKRKTI